MTGLPVQELLSPDCYPHPVDGVQLIETHISWVFLAGDYAYKLKKPVDLGFLDFTTLADREHYCHEELRLSRRLAPDLYLDVVTLRREDHRLRFDGVGEVVEFAVRMRRFEQEAQLDRRLEAGLLDTDDIDGIAELIGRFHLSAPTAESGSPWGSPETVVVPVRENFSHLGPAMDCGRRGTIVERLRGWSETRFLELREPLLGRREQGRIRECHGDLHLRNMALVDDRIVAFDGIEFDPALRWIDVVSDCAFLIMDLESRGRRDLAWRFLNRWLEITGDYAALELLPWYLVYRHMVRAKVDAIRLGQAGLDEAEATRLRQRIDSHLSLAMRATEARAGALLLTSGVSGSGKSWLAERLSVQMPAIWIRSDVERKRLFGMAPDERPDPDRVRQVYSPETTRRVYERMAGLASAPLSAGYAVILDATFLGREQREQVMSLHRDRGSPALIVACEADRDTLMRRVSRRATSGSDPSDAGPSIAERQLRAARPVGLDEPVIRVDTSGEIDVAALAREIERRIEEQDR
jgi:aminoglycoside phosphotransferase family enzyme/gluconate kinase